MTEPKPKLTSEQLLAAIGQAVIATDPDGTIVYWNPAAERLYGWGAAEVLGRNIAEVTVPQMSQEIASAIMASLRAGTPWAGGFVVRRRDGSLFRALVTDAGVYSDGELVGIVGVSAHLGTAMQPLLERSADAALVLAGDGIVQYASPAVDVLFGWQPDDLVGKSLTTFLDPRDHGALDRILHRSGSRVGQVIELRVQAANGVTTAEAVVTDLRDDPSVRAVVCNLRHSERLTRLRERERISRSAHADILQKLFGVTLDLAAAQSTASPAERARLDMATDQIRDAIAALRRLLAPQTDPDTPD